MTDTAMPAVVDRATWQAEREALLVREKAHTRAGDAIAAARRRLPMVKVDPAITLVGPHGRVPLVEVFEGRRQLVACHVRPVPVPGERALPRLHGLGRALVLGT